MHHMTSLPPNFHIIWSTITSVTKKTSNTSIKTLTNINLFLQQKFSTNTHHIMIPLHRSTYKDSKKSSFAILWFLYKLLWISKVSASFQKDHLQHYSYEYMTMHKSPWTWLCCCMRSLVVMWNRGALETVIPAMGVLPRGEEGAEEHKGRESYL